MEKQELKEFCQKFLTDHFGKFFEINEVSDDADGLVYSTLHEWNLNGNQKGVISFWCSNCGWESEDGSIKEDDIVYWLCLERYISVTKDNMKDYLKTQYESIYDDSCYEDIYIKEKKLFVQVYFTNGKAKNTVYISYCFKNDKSNCDEEFYDFFKQLIAGNFISVEEIAELKESIVAKYIRIDEDGNKNTISNSYLQNIYDGLIASNQWNSNWFSTYERVVEKFVDCGKNESWDEETLSLLIKNVENGISSLRQKNFENADYARIKADWVNIQPIVKRICTSTGVDENACEELSVFLYQRSRQKLHSAVHRVIAAFLPNKVSTIVKKDDFDYVSKKLSEKLKDYPSITNDWLKDNISFIDYCNKNVKFVHPWHSSLFAWHLKKFFEQEDKNQRERDMKIDEIVRLLENNHNIILHGAPGTGKTYLAKQIAKILVFPNKSVDEKLSEEEQKQFDEQYGFVQFHQSYDYTDFVEGLRPVQNGDSTEINFERKNGVFKEFCKKAIGAHFSNFDSVYKDFTDKLKASSAEPFELQTLIRKKKFKVRVNGNNGLYATPYTAAATDMPITEDNLRTYVETGEIKDWKPYVTAIGEYLKDNYSFGELTNDDSRQSKKFIFVIDEINRGEISKIFGELFFSIDPGYRGEKGRIKTQYQNLVDDKDVFAKGFYIPENVYIIGTMNDIDRSVESMDFAMRRRFAFKEITADERIEMLDSLKCGKKNDAVKCMQALNKEIEKISGLSSAYHIGPAYFLKLDNYEGNFEDLWKYHIDGILREYLRGMPKADDHLTKLKDCYDKSLAVEKSDAKDDVSDSAKNP